MPEALYVRIPGHRVRWLQVESADELAAELRGLRPGRAWAYAIAIGGAVHVYGAARFKELLRTAKQARLDGPRARAAFLYEAVAAPAQPGANPARRSYEWRDAVWIPTTEVGQVGRRAQGPITESAGTASRGDDPVHDLEALKVQSYPRREEVPAPDEIDEIEEAEEAYELEADAEPEADREPEEDPELEEADGGPPFRAVSPEPIRRTPHLDVIPEPPLAAGQAFDIRIYCDTRAPAAGETSSLVVVSPRPGEDRVTLGVWLAASDHFDVGTGRGELTIVRDEPESRPLELPAQVVDDPPPGPGRITAAFSHDGLPAGHVTRTVEFDGPSAEQDAGDEPAAPERILVRWGQGRPDLIVEIKAVSEDARTYAVRVLTEVRTNPPPQRWYVEETTPGLVAAYMEEFTAPGLGDDERKSQLLGTGTELWKAAPKEFTDVFWSLVDDPEATLESILVVSDDWAFPWELMVPHRGAGKNLEIRKPLGIEFRVGRWVGGESVMPQERIPMDTSYTLAPWYAAPNTLKWGPAEAEFVCEHFEGELIKPADYDGIEERFRERGVSLFHVICHGEASSSRSQVIRLAKGTRWLSHQILTMEALRPAIAATEPMIFLNACDVGRPHPSLIGVGGFATAFILAGARCVIAPLWSVSDEIAHQVATEFYTSVLEQPERPLADILRVLRRRADGENGADTWAAYCFYGNPLAVREAAR